MLERTRLSRRAFYERFGGKDDLILAVFEKTLRNGADEFRAELAEVDDPLERLRFIIEAMLLGAQSDPIIRNAVAMSGEHPRLADARPNPLEIAHSKRARLIHSTTKRFKNPALGSDHGRSPQGSRQSSA